MKLDLVRPCKDCPFKNDAYFYLAPDRLQGIVHALLHDQTFTCHETIDYRALNESGEFVPDEKNQHCAGALIMLAKADRLYDNVLYRLAVMGKFFDPSRLDLTSPIVTLEEIESYVREENQEVDDPEGG